MSAVIFTAFNIVDLGQSSTSPLIVLLINIVLIIVMLGAFVGLLISLVSIFIASKTVNKNEGEACAISIKQDELSTLGYDQFWTATEYKKIYGETKKKQ